MDWPSVDYRDNPPHRGCFTPEELRSHGLRHPSHDSWRGHRPTILWLMKLCLLSLVVAFYFSSTSLYLLAAGFAVSAAGIALTVLDNQLDGRFLRPDVFVGWGFPTEERATFIVSDFILVFSRQLLPDWGVVACLPPPKDSAARVVDDAGGRGSQWPFVFRVDRDDKWWEAVNWVISQSRAAIIDGRGGMTPSLRRELSAAKTLLGAGRVIELHQNSSGRTTASVGGRPLETPQPIPETVYQSWRLSRNDVDIVCAILAWIMSELPVDRATASRHQRWMWIERRIVWLSKWMMVIGLGAIGSSLIWGVVALVRYLL